MLPTTDYFTAQKTGRCRTVGQPTFIHLLILLEFVMDTIEETKLLESHFATLNFMGITNLRGTLKDMLELKHFIESNCFISDIQYMERQDAADLFPKLFEEENQFAKVNLLEPPQIGIELECHVSKSPVTHVFADNAKWKQARENRNKRFEEERIQQELDEGSLA